MKTYIINGIVALLLIIGVGLVVPKTQPAPQQSNLGGLSERDIQAVSLKVGSTGTKVNQVNTGTCYLQPNAATIAATTTVDVTCQGKALIFNPNTVLATALTGVKSGDFVNVTLSTTTASTAYGNIVLAGASASTTAGFITLRITNLTGSTFTWPTTGNATGTASYISSR